MSTLESDKFGLRYRLTVEIENNQAIVIEYPTTVEFQVNRAMNGGLGYASFSVYNLSPDNRNKLTLDRYGLLDNKKIRKVIFEAGYDSNNSVAIHFIGNIFQAYSIRNGENIITKIESKDGLFASQQSFISKTLSEGTSVSLSIGLLATTMLGIDNGKLSDFVMLSSISPNERLVDNESYIGNSWQLLKEKYNDEIFIDLNVLKYLKVDDAFTVNNQVLVINARTGLLETPTRMDTFLTVNTLFESRVMLGQAIQVDSLYSKQYNGQYKVVGINSNGTISGNVESKATTIFQLLVNNSVV